MIVLTVNAGSSSIRLAALEQAAGQMRCIAAIHGTQPGPAREDALRNLLSRLDGARVDVVAHRVVHGGDSLVDACIIDAPVEAEISRLAPLAPLHNPAAVAWLQACRAVLGTQVPQVAVFDTAFYAQLPPVARTYALPRELSERLHLRRFGFHGLAHQGMLRRWRELEPGVTADARVISLQLGAGCSITATRGGIPVDTSMGFSPLEGLMMATRSGDVDPGLLLYLQRTQSLTPENLEHMLNSDSGLLGVSGISADMKLLLESDAPAARLAVALYCHRARKYVGAYLAVLGGADAILIGGGVGENAPAVRERILGELQWAGIDLDPALNRAAAGVEARISAAGRPSGTCGTSIWTVAVNESVILAEEALRTVGHQPQRNST
jgi:acetate kinase